VLSKQEIKEIDAELQKYPDHQAACVEAMKIVQRQRGWISDESLSDLAGYLQMTREELDNVATFYPMIFREPVGKHVILVCDSVSCWIVDQEKLRKGLSERLDIQPGETSRDGQFTLLPVPCLGACDHAPVMMIDEDLYQEVDAGRIQAVLSQYQSPSVSLAAAENPAASQTDTEGSH
jgi:NADH-quinone oxidoreductase subunit E